MITLNVVFLMTLREMSLIKWITLVQGNIGGSDVLNNETLTVLKFLQTIAKQLEIKRKQILGFLICIYSSKQNFAEYK